MVCGTNVNRYSVISLFLVSHGIANYTSPGDEHCFDVCLKAKHERSQQSRVLVEGMVCGTNVNRYNVISLFLVSHGIANYTSS